MIYKIDSWLAKNVEQINPNLVELFKRSSSQIFSKLWDDFENVSIKDQSFLKNTFATKTENSINETLGQIRSGNTRFVHCLKSNDNPQSQKADSKVILKQLRNNGIVSATRMAKIGLPHQFSFASFWRKYQLLAKNCRENFTDSKKASKILLQSLNDIDHESDYQLGRKSIFLKKSFFENLEDKLAKKLNLTISNLQAICLGKIQRRKFEKMKDECEAARVIQSNWRDFSRNRNWEWMKILFKLRPVFKNTDLSQEVKELQDIINKKDDLLLTEKQKREKFEDELMILNEERNIMAVKLQSGLLSKT